MRRTLSAVFLLGLFALAAGFAEAEPMPDSVAAKRTRTTVLKTKISIDLNNEPLRAIIEELKGAVKDAKGGIVRIKPLPSDGGITLTSRMTIKATDETLEDVLDKLLKEKNWGYIVWSDKPDSQDDGAIMLVTKPLRGFPEDAKGTTKTEAPKKEVVKKDDPKKEVVKKDDPKKEEPKKEPESGDKDEKMAANRLTFAELYLEQKKPDRAKPILEEIVKKYPTTKAAETAKKLLEKIK